MPAYNANSMFAVFFIIYILINTYIFMSVFLAVVYNNYKKYLKVTRTHTHQQIRTQKQETWMFVCLPLQEEVRQLVRAKRHKMVRAFAVLQEQREEGGEPVVTQANWNQLVRLVQPDISSAHRELLWSVSDDKNQGHIGGSHTRSAFLPIMQSSGGV